MTSDTVATKAGDCGYEHEQVILHHMQKGNKISDASLIVLARLIAISLLFIVFTKIKIFIH